MTTIREAEAFAEWYNSVEEYNKAYDECSSCGWEWIFDWDTMVCIDCDHCW